MGELACQFAAHSVCPGVAGRIDSTTHGALWNLPVADEQANVRGRGEGGERQGAEPPERMTARGVWYSPAAARFDPLEAGSQLLLQAFLQRIVNGGGRIERESGLGRGRTDLLIVWRQGGRTRKFVVECKLLHKGLEHTVREGLRQTVGYMDRCATESRHLIVFDRTEGRQLGRQDIPPPRARGRQGDHRVGNVTRPGPVNACVSADDCGSGRRFHNRAVPLQCGPALRHRRLQGCAACPGFTTTLPRGGEGDTIANIARRYGGSCDRGR